MYRLFSQLDNWYGQHADELGWLGSLGTFISLYYEQVGAAMAFLIFVIGSACKHWYAVKIEREKLLQEKIRTKNLQNESNN
jgi:hypothetical protein